MTLLCELDLVFCKVAYLLVTVASSLFTDVLLLSNQVLQKSNDQSRGGDLWEPLQTPLLSAALPPPAPARWETCLASNEVRPASMGYVCRHSSCASCAKISFIYLGLVTSFSFSFGLTELRSLTFLLFLLSLKYPWHVKPASATARPMVIPVHNKLAIGNISSRRWRECWTGRTQIDRHRPVLLPVRSHALNGFVNRRK